MIPSGLSIQRTLAEELHNLANVPLRQCDLNDVKTFQSALPGYQINIVSKESFNAIVYQVQRPRRRSTCITTIIIMT